jgi:hypothetical protein
MFGIPAPLLAFVIVCSVAFQSITTRLMLGRFLIRCAKQKEGVRLKQLQILQRNCKGIVKGIFWTNRFAVLVPTSGLFALYLYDMYAFDKSGIEQYVPSIVKLLLFWLLELGYQIYKRVYVTHKDEAPEQEMTVELGEVTSPISDVSPWNTRSVKSVEIG